MVSRPMPRSSGLLRVPKIQVPGKRDIDCRGFLTFQPSDPSGKSHGILQLIECQYCPISEIQLATELSGILSSIAERMKSLTSILAIFAILLSESALSQAVLVGDPDNPEYRDSHKQYMEVSGVILDICVYEREFVPSKDEDKVNPPWTSGKLTHRAVVTGVHKGDTKVGTKIEIVETVIDPPEFLKKYRSVVEGELLTFFYFGEELPKAKNGRHIVDHNLMYFDRDKDEEVKAFLKGLQSNPNQKNQSEQAGAGKSATASESKSEGGDKPKPVSEPAPR